MNETYPRGADTASRGPISGERHGKRGDPGVNGIIHRLSSGCQCRKLPERFSPWLTVHKRHMLWSAHGTLERLLQAVADASSKARRGQAEFV
ncbi:transposase [Streptomyces sp. NPDC051219]|uniref:transposase n=1 Tax=Streptomyces sp. NPDC051219 TaxID=3155283 RepID=UPI00344A2B13